MFELAAGKSHHIEAEIVATDILGEQVLTGGFNQVAPFSPIHLLGRMSELEG